MNITEVPYFKKKDFLIDIIVAVAFLGASLIGNFYSSRYATESVSNPVTDIVLSNIPVYDVDGIFVYGAIALVMFIIVACLSYPRSIPFTIKSISFFTFIRSIAISLTHISPFPTRAPIRDTFFTTGPFRGIFNGDDLFFSGHTGLPFLLALIFWKFPLYRYIFLSSSVIFGLIVLLGHYHYSIDVFSAFFITYTVFHLSKIFFKKNWALMRSEIK